jgi:hypothetical protein
VSAAGGSAVERVEAALEAIDRLDGSINAFTVVLAGEARATARAVDRGEFGGPLAGVPIAIKDHVWMRGAPATNGSLAYADFVPAEDCVCVARLRAAGAVLVGKTNNPEFCYRGITDNALFGPTRNPRDLERTPGGSSGGSARRWRPGWSRSRSARTAAGRSASPRRSAGSSATSRRSGSCRSCRASAAGRRSRSTGRSAAAWARSPPCSR